MGIKVKDLKAKKKALEGRAKMFFLDAEIRQRRKLRCPMCGRQTEAVVDPKKVTYCSVCVGKFYESMGIKPMIDLGAATQVVGIAETKYGKGRLKSGI